MLEKQRLEWIRDMLESERSVTVKDAALQLGVSEATVRRDAHRMEECGEARMVRGLLLPVRLPEKEEQLADIMDAVVPQDKMEIARQAVRLVQPYDTLFLDSTVIASAIAQCLPAKKEMRVFTNGIRTAEILAERGIRTVLAGGSVQRVTGHISGCFAEQLMRDIRPDLYFATARGIAPDGRVCSVNDLRLSQYRILHANAVKTVLCITSDRFGLDLNVTYDRLENVDEVVSDQPLPPELRARVGLNRENGRRQEEGENHVGQ